MPLELPFAYDAYINLIFDPSSFICAIKLWRSRERVLEREFERFVRSVRIVSEFKVFAFQQSERSVLNLYKYAKLTLLHTFTRKTIFDKLFHSSSYMRLTFYLDFEELIFDQISSNTHPNRMGLVSSCSRREILSY